MALKNILLIIIIIIIIIIIFGLYQTESSSSMEKPAKQMHSSSGVHKGVSDVGPSKVCVVQTL